MEPKNIVKPHANNQNSQQSHQKCMKGVNQVPWPQKKHTACKYLATFTNYLHTNLMSLLTMELRSFNELKETLSYITLVASRKPFCISQANLTHITFAASRKNFANSLFLLCPLIVAKCNGYQKGNFTRVIGFARLLVQFKRLLLY